VSGALRRPTIKEWPPGERPRERLLAEGAGALSDAELLAIVLRSGSAATGETALDLARRLLAGGGLVDLAGRGAAELAGLPGVGSARGAQVAAACELARRIARSRAARKRIGGPRDAYALLDARLGGLDRERFEVLLLDTKHRVLGVEMVSLGGLDSAPVHPREVFKPAIRRGAAAVIVGHNHPSGDPAPSPDDVEMTRRLVGSGELLGIPVLDHIIVGERRFCSLRAEGVGW
jgi:DNA repair protein RadC